MAVAVPNETFVMWEMKLATAESGRKEERKLPCKEETTVERSRWKKLFITSKEKNKREGDSR